jgi:hypothetical protein
LVMPHSSIETQGDLAVMLEKILYLPARSRFGEGRAVTLARLSTSKVI